MYVLIIAAILYSSFILHLRLLLDRRGSEICFALGCKYDLRCNFNKLKLKLKLKPGYGPLSLLRSGNRYH